MTEKSDIKINGNIPYFIVCVESAGILREAVN